MRNVKSILGLKYHLDYRCIGCLSQLAGYRSPLTECAIMLKYNGIRYTIRLKPLLDYIEDECELSGIKLVTARGKNNLNYISRRIESIRNKAINKEFKPHKGESKMSKKDILNELFDQSTSQVHGLKKVILRMEDTFFSSSLKQMKARFGIEMMIKRDRDIETFTSWVKSHDPKFQYHVSNAYSVNGNKNNNKSLLMGIFVLKVADGTYLYIDAESERIFSRDDSDYSPIYIYLFGKHWREVLEDITKHFETLNTTTNKIYSIVGVKDGERSYWSCTASKLVPRTMDTIFIGKDQKKRITDHIDQWLENETMYTDRGLLYKTGILLHGPAGTGKSSMAMAIANYLGCGLITIDPGTFQFMNISEITESIVADETKYVVLIDEIDAIFKSRENENITDEQLKVTNKLLSFLDSAQSPTGVIFVATTNYPDRLDKSLLRKGRFDVIEEMNDIPIEVGREMCTSFSLSDKETDEVIAEVTKDEKEPVDFINPANLQDGILTYLKKKNKSIKGSMKEVDEPEIADKLLDGDGKVAYKVEPEEIKEEAKKEKNDSLEELRELMKNGKETNREILKESNEKVEEYNQASKMVKDSLELGDSIKLSKEIEVTDNTSGDNMVSAIIDDMKDKLEEIASSDVMEEDINDSDDKTTVDESSNVEEETKSDTVEE